MFSRRTRWDRTRNRLAQSIEQLSGSGRPLLDLTESNPTRVGLQAPVELLELLANPSGLSYEPEPRGRRAAREAVAADCARRGVRRDPDEIVLTASTSEAYSLVFKLLCDPGDHVLAPRPSYPLFDFLAGLDSVVLDSYACRYDGEWHIPLAELEAATATRTRALLVVSPNNPTGAFVRPDEATALLELCARRDLALVADEVFADYRFGGRPETQTCLASDGPALSFCLGGLSKSCGLPQLKLGWIAVAGPRALREEALARLEIVADTYLSVGTPIQLALPEILRRQEELRRPIQARVEANRRHLETRLGRESPAGLLRADGGWQAVLRVPDTLTEEERVVHLLDESGVLVHPGYFFDFESGAHLVLSLLPPRDTFEAGVAAILAQLQRG